MAERVRSPSGRRENAPGFGAARVPIVRARARRFGQEVRMASVDNLALFIGVNDYSAFDVSTGKDKGASNLLGSRNDAIVFWHVCRLIGVPPANIRILTSPRLSHD